MVDYGHMTRQIAIGFGIALIFPLLVYYGVCSLHPPPNWQDYFENTVAIGGAPTPAERQADLDKQQASKAAYAAATKAFAKFLLLVTAPLGIAAIAIGASMRNPPISAGLIIGGIVTVGIGYWAYWENLQGWFRFLTLLAAFIVLLIAAGRQASKAAPGHHGTAAPRPQPAAHPDCFGPHRSDGAYDPLPENEYRDIR